MSTIQPTVQTPVAPPPPVQAPLAFTYLTLKAVGRGRVVGSAHLRLSAVGRGDSVLRGDGRGFVKLTVVARGGAVQRGRGTVTARLTAVGRGGAIGRGAGRVTMRLTSVGRGGEIFFGVGRAVVGLVSDHNLGRAFHSVASGTARWAFGPPAVAHLQRSGDTLAGATATLLPVRGVAPAPAPIVVEEEVFA